MPEKNWSVELSKRSLKHLERLGQKNKNRILRNLEELEDMDNPLLHRDVRPLIGKLRGFHRLRIGDFRIIFGLDRKKRRIGIHIIVSREDAY
jgi:mRNA-degrading endonuclease RelE of RelBE toxin-antitoxin system